MRRFHTSLFPSFLLACVFVACSDASTPPGASDASEPPDAAVDGGGTSADGGLDGGPDNPDGSLPADGGGADLGGGDAGANVSNPNNRMLDTDCDGLSDQEEFATIFADGSRTNPNLADTDGDDLPDGLELGRTAAVPGTRCAPPPAVDADPASTTSPTLVDSDGDGLRDGVEDRNLNGRVDADETDPNASDSDGDRLADGLEDANRNGTVDTGETNPTRADTDGDGIEDGVEDANRNGSFDDGETDPTRADTDGDTLRDGDEDANANGLREPGETDPTSPDTDCDGLRDDAELNATPPTSPVNPDTDGDAIPDGIEAGLTAASLPPDCPPFTADADPSTTTLVGTADSDMDGLADGVEDANQNGRVDPGETDPNVADTDMDGLNDGDEVRAGFDPLDGTDPGAGTVTGINDVCSDANLKSVDFDVAAGSWTVANETSTAYAFIPVASAGSGVEVAALDDATNRVSGFVVAMPLLSGPANLAAQVSALESRIQAGVSAEGLTYTSRASPRNITSHDGLPTAVSGLVELASTSDRNAAVLRNAMLRLVSNLPATAFSGLPTGTGTANRNYIYGFQVLLRSAPARLIVVGGLLDATAFDNAADRKSIVLSDLVNGTALARHDAPRDKDCDPFTTSGQAVADFIWMADVSGSTDDDRGRITAAAGEIFTALGQNNVDFRMGVVPHFENRFKFAPANAGDLRGVGFTTDRNLFIQYLEDNSGQDGCEFGLTAASDALRKALPRSPAGVTDARKLRAGATVAVVYVSDEFAEEIQDTACHGYSKSCTTGINDFYDTQDQTVCASPVTQACIDTTVQPYVQELLNENGVAFAQVIAPNATPTNCTGYACPGGQPENEPGRGYIEVVNATGGVFYSPCSNTPGNALRPIIDAVTGAASQFQLTGNPISSTVRVGVVRGGVTTIVPRDKQNGFDYDPASNSIFFRGTSFSPNQGELVVISYRLWAPAPAPCPPGQVRDPNLGVCVCDMALCNQNCGPNEFCDSTCACACAPNCNGTCGPGEVCNPANCACECPSDCGGCPTGTTCNQATCQCECQDCGGACENTNQNCNQASCACECPADCGGTCTGNAVCNDSLCECVCPADCSDACSGFAECDPSRNCDCVCPTDCGGNCTGAATCDSASCQCQCPAGCDEACPGLQQCNPDSGCQCECPSNCGGACGADERCERSTCECVPRA